jgi:hypothetical protein
MATMPIKQLTTLSSRGPMIKKTLTSHRTTFEMFTGLHRLEETASADSVMH